MLVSAWKMSGKINNELLCVTEWEAHTDFSFYILLYTLIFLCGDTLLLL